MSRAITPAMRLILEAAVADSRGRVKLAGRSRRALLDRGLIADDGQDWCVITDAGRAAVARARPGRVTYNPCMTREDRAKVGAPPPSAPGRCRTPRDEWNDASAHALADAKEWRDRTAIGALTVLDPADVIADLARALEDPLHASNVKTEEEYDAAIAAVQETADDYERLEKVAREERAEWAVRAEDAEGKLEQAQVDLTEARAEVERLRSRWTDAERVASAALDLAVTGYSRGWDGLDRADAMRTVTDLRKRCAY